MEHREPVVLENEGKKIFAVFHKPICLHPFPAVVICPGFGGNKCGKFRIFVTLAQELTKRGIGVLRFDYRGAGDSEGEFQDVTFEGKIADTLTCLHFLSDNKEIDSSRLGILGRSLGGAVAITAARRSRIKSLALWAPVFTSQPWKELWQSVQKNQHVDISKEDILRHLPISVPNIDFLTQFFKMDLEKELNGISHVPLLHIQGMQDLTVKEEHAKGFEEVRKGVQNTRFIQLPKSDHEFSCPQEQAVAIQETCSWYQNTL